MLRTLAVCLLLLAPWVAVPSGAQELQPVPALDARVTDLTGTLTAAQQAALEQELAAFEQRKGAQVALLIVPTTRPEAIEQYAIRVVEAWRLGRARVDDGVLLLVALEDRALRIEVGYGLEGVLPDAIARRIIDETITPLFRQRDIHGGVAAGLRQIMLVVEGEPLPPADHRWYSPPDRITGLLPILFMGVLVGGAVLRQLFGRGLGALVTGGAAGLVAWLLSGAILIAIVVAVMAWLFGLFAGFAGGVRPGRHGGWGGWGGPMGRGGGFGGGGFRGGGGGFGGGGASGRW